MCVRNLQDRNDYRRMKLQEELGWLELGLPRAYFVVWFVCVCVCVCLCLCLCVCVCVCMCVCRALTSSSLSPHKPPQQTLTG